MMSRLAVLVIAASLVLTAGASEAQHCFDRSIDAEQLNRSISETSFETFRSLEPGMTRDAVRDLVGSPTYLCGSGMVYDVYVLGDGLKVSVAYIDGRTAWAFVSGGEKPGERVLFGESGENGDTHQR